MNFNSFFPRWFPKVKAPWADIAPVREELFGIERLEQHAESLAAAQLITSSPPAVLSLQKRLDDNSRILLAAYRASAQEVESGRRLVPAAEWLLDNYHVVEEQIREIRDDLPVGYYRQLPKLATGPFVGYPRVFGIAWAFVAHTDSYFDPEVLRRFIRAYQRVQPLTIGELWAIAITLRIVLVENLRRLAEQMTAGRELRSAADALADRLLVKGHAHSALQTDIHTRVPGPLSELFAAQLARRLRDQDPNTMPALGWLEERLKLQGMTIDLAVHHAQQRQVASNVTIRNIITSMRLISDIAWADFVESVSLVDDRLRAESNFSEMDFPTRNLYRSAIEQLARGSSASEIEVAEHALRLSAAAARLDEKTRNADPGYFLIAEGRSAIERTIGFRPSALLRFRRFTVHLGIGGYVGAISLVAIALLWLGLWTIPFGIHFGWLVLLAVPAFIPATDIATALVNRAITLIFEPTLLPGLELPEGVPQSLRTIVVVPTLLTSPEDVLEQIERLEIHYLSGAHGHVYFALLSDFVDADEKVLEGDEHLLSVAADGIAELNQRYGPGPDSTRFYLLHRHRLFNEQEKKWIGWERKRGKLHELNRLLRGDKNTSFMTIAGQAPLVPSNVRYVITLDADTRLPRDAALRLVGKMGHPLNRARLDEGARRVVSGYGILQPRIAPALPIGNNGSLYQRVFSGPGGMDPYAAAISDVYQDLFGEGSFTGKGIYDLDAFEASLTDRVPENALLSHDLFEGIFARSGLASDIELVEDFPERYDVIVSRQHRWTRGDWQLLPWILGRRSHRVPLLGRAKMLDNLRRSLLSPSLMLTLGLCWLVSPTAAKTGALGVLATFAIPAFLPSIFAIYPSRVGISLRSHLQALASDLIQQFLQTFFSLAFLADNAWRTADAIVRTLLRLSITKRQLLEWTTTAQSADRPLPDIVGFYRRMAGGTIAGLAIALGALAVTPQSWPFALPYVLLWLVAPYLAWWASRPPRLAQDVVLTAHDVRELRVAARTTWRFFETFVTQAENMLPPDNFQESPAPVVAHRTSPTNIGIYLLSAVAARDFGWAGTTETVERLEAAFDTLKKLPRYRGHFLNWYGTQDLRPLDPGYVSSVDSGNFAGHLIALAVTCDEWRKEPLERDIRPGLKDNLSLAHRALKRLPESTDSAQIGQLLDQMRQELQGVDPVAALSPTLRGLAELAATKAQNIVDEVSDDILSDLRFWIERLQRAVVQDDRDRLQDADGGQELAGRLKSLSENARELALSMDFAFLLDPARKLLSIGYSLLGNNRDPSCYDLLASEARLASFFAIAKGDIPTRHWFRLGRTSTPTGIASALISWSGSMFEYLMPSLVMRAPSGSLLDQTSRLVVERQKSYARSLGIPWGISESAYNSRDLEFTYQYSNFGVPGLGLKRGLSENVVIAPYATALAAMVDPGAARKNFASLTDLGVAARYGFYEAVDFTRSRLQENEPFAIVRCFMAHHQGMTIVAIFNALNAGRMRSRFHSEPMIRASELLLQERVPRDVAVARPRAEEVHKTADDASTILPTVRRILPDAAEAPITHLLSNGRYSVMLTSAGGGYSRWRDIAITRWREDATRDNWGSFIFFRDMQTGGGWSAGVQPVGGSTQFDEVVFSEDRAEFVRRDRALTTRTTVIVSSEDDGEVRRVMLVNNGRESRKIELTTYAELVLGAQAADSAHPAFSKLFVETEYVPEFKALIASRRPRSSSEPRVWAAHFSLVNGESIADTQYETDRARFIGRNRSVASPAAFLKGRSLSNTVGTVLDPIFTIRERLNIPPGGTAEVAFWTIVAPSRDQLLDLIDKHNDKSAFDRAKTLAWTQAQVQLRHLDVTPEEAEDFQRVAAPILYADRRFRPSSTAILRGLGAQSGLWPHAISGDLPIVLLRIDDIDDMTQVRQLLRAHDYWRLKRLPVDLVIMNERGSSYTQDLQTAIEAAIRSSQSRPSLSGEPASGSVFALRADLLTVEARSLLIAAARVVAFARRGSIAEQLAGMVAAATPVRPRVFDQQRRGRSERPTSNSQFSTVTGGLEFFNGYGGFDKQGREYVIALDSTHVTPAPWINVIANPNFGFQVSAEGSGYTWAENSRENQITSWSNDPIEDPTTEAFYVRDELTGDLWTPTALPIRDDGGYVARHGFGYSSFEHEANGILVDLLQFVPISDPVKISRLTLRNLSGKPRRLSVTAYTEWVLGSSRATTSPFIVTEIDDATHAVLARNPWSIAFPGRVSFADLGGSQQTWTADRTEFLGRLGGPATPVALSGGIALSGASGAGLDPCAALQTVVELAVGERIELVSLLGQCASVHDARVLITRYRDTGNVDKALNEVQEHWTTVLAAVQVKTPDRAMDIMLNGWLLYQTLSCRIWARSAFYQASGAYGFRDQLQDGMALSFAVPQETRRHILRAAARQFIQGDVQHWWLPHTGQGVRTRISDDRVWLAFATATYVATSGDTAILDESIPFLDGPALHPGEHDAFFQPMVADHSASLFEHCARGLDQSLTLTGDHGLPLIGTGDWNDGMNRVGENGIGESVWLGWLLIRTISLFAPLADGRDPDRARRWRDHAEAVRSAIENSAWDGEWYRRATFDDGTWLGSKENEECRIDSIAQSWSVLSGAADPVRAATAMKSLERELIRQPERLALLFTPPFNNTTRDPGYIKGYPPGLRENGGQYSHAGMWACLAFAQMGLGEKAHDLFALLNPINHSRTPIKVASYKVEPYVVAADIYSVPPHVGRGGWTWYTGSAAWMYRAGIEGILGIRRGGDVLTVAPCIPPGWPGFEASVTVESTCYAIRVENAHGPSHGISAANLDGVAISSEGPIRVPLDGLAHTLVLSLEYE